MGSGFWSNAPSLYRWPTLETHWTDPKASAPPKSRFYEVAGEPIRAAERGKILGVTNVTSLTTNKVQAALANHGLTSSSPPRWPVRIVKIVYETVDPFGLPIQASGGLYLPLGATNALPLTSYQHGTVLYRFEVPSNYSFYDQVDTESPIGPLFATDGYAIAMPDYIGLGDSPGIHPYFHAKTEATAVVDMLRAARTYCATNGVALNDQLFLLGHSEGGHATMATHREIEAYHTNEFVITASAPLSGPYDWSGVELNFIFRGSFPFPGAIPHTLGSYVSIYRLADTLQELLAAPYNLTIPPLLDGSHFDPELDTATGSQPLNILRSDVRASFVSDPTSPLRMAWRDNDVYEWTPQAPMHLYSCHGDTIVSYQNAVTAYQSFTNRQACCVSLTDPGLPQSLDHSDCLYPSVLAAKQWFDSLRH
jgi:pimeloyl-ACP methyl ester carboxylesterase